MTAAPTADEDHAPGALEAATGLREHPRRAELHHEVHARPFEPLRAPVRASHIALLSGEGAAAVAADRDHLAGLCARHGVAPPPAGARHFSADLGPFRLKWERHTEFTTYTFFRPGAGAQPFAEPAIGALPRDWLAAAPGEAIVAIHLEIEPADGPEWGRDELARLFRPDDIVSSRLDGGAAQLWSDLRANGDGFVRVLLRDLSLSERQAGRLAQHLLEIGTYRMMALLALPIAREVWPQITAADRALADITRRVSEPAGPGEGAADEGALLDELSRLAAEIERISAATSDRFAAARAYYALVERRLAELGEERVADFQGLSLFMARRLAPAMETCDSVARRQEALAARISRASELLRTRVDVALEHQNRDLLASMNRRARLQLRLQQTVEGLSAAAITYYVVSLLGYLFQALKAGGLGIDVGLARGFSIVPVAVLVWLGVRRVRRAVMRAAGGAAGDRDRGDAHPAQRGGGSTR